MNKNQKKNQKIKASIEQRTTQPRTDCGKSFEHEWHLYSVKKGKKTCDGDLKKRLS